MCRMLIAFGNVDMDSLIDGMLLMAKDQNSKHEHNENKEQGEWDHPDGWGISYLKDEKWIIEKSDKPIFNDPRINELRNIKTNLVILHARKKSMSAEVSIKNAHPFNFKWKEEDFVFCHNGTIKDEISYDPSFETIGETDSEKLFYSILTDINGKITEQAIKENLELYKTSHGSNIILSSKEKSFVYLKENNMSKYYTMKVGKKDDFLVVSSETLPNLGVEWNSLETGKVLIVDNEKLTFSEY